MPFVLPPGVAIGSQEAIYLQQQYISDTASGGMLPMQGTEPLGYQQITNDALATVQHLARPAGALQAVIENNGSQPCRWRDDPGGAPTETMGRVIEPSDTISYSGDLTAIRFIRGGDGVTLDISFYK